MRKVTLALALAIVIAFTFDSEFASAQSDGFFSKWNNTEDNRDIVNGGIDMPGLPGSHGYGDDQDAPLGSGLLIFTVLGAGYFVARRKKSV